MGQKILERDTTEHRKKLSGLPFLQGLPGDAKEKICAVIERVSEETTASSGEELLQEGHLAFASGYILLQGTVSVEREGLDSVELAAPSLLGEMSQFIHDDALRVVEQHPNAYGDVSTLQSLAADGTDTFGMLLRRAMDGPARERVMYGSDWPTQRPLDAAFVRALRGGIQSTTGDPYLTNEETTLLLRNNAQRFLALTPA